MNRLLLPLSLVTLLPLLIQADNFGCKSYLRFGAITKNSVVTCPKDNCAHLEGTTSIGLKFEAGGCDIGNCCNGQGKIQEQTFTRDEWNRKFPENGLPEFIQDVKVSGSCCYQEYCS